MGFAHGFINSSRSHPYDFGLAAEAYDIRPLSLKEPLCPKIEAGRVSILSMTKRQTSDDHLVNDGRPLHNDGKIQHAINGKTNTVSMASFNGQFCYVKLPEASQLPQQKSLGS